MCGRKQEMASTEKPEPDVDQDLEPTHEFQAMPDEVQETLRDRKTEVLSQAVIQEKLDQIRESISEPEKIPEVQPKTVSKSDSKRRFSETMWFMHGLDSDQLVEDSDEDVASDDLQDRYEKQSEMKGGIRKQFTLNDDKDGGKKASKDERADS
jgi:hypothetical protein